MLSVECAPQNCQALQDLNDSDEVKLLVLFGQALNASLALRLAWRASKKGRPSSTLE